MARHRPSLLALLLAAAAVPAGEPRAPANGPKRVDPGRHVLAGASLHAAPGRLVERGFVEIRDGRIVRVGQGAAPEGARDLSGLHLYAGLVDAFVESDAPRPDPASPGAHWNRRVMPQRSVLDGSLLPREEAEALRKLGFCAAALSPRGGNLRGRGAVVSLAERPEDPSAPLPPVYRDDAFETVSLDTVPDGEEGYPDSQMGAIALVRQTLLDRGPAAAPLPLLFDVADELEVLRASRIAKEFGARAIVAASGLEFRRLEAVVAAGLPLVVPLAFPEKPDVASVGAAESAELREMMTWEQAPSNPRRLQAAGALVALTTARLKDRAQFRKRLQEAMRHGLDAETALAMLTANPARMLGLEAELGTIEPGRRANLVVADGPLFAKGTRILEVWIDGRRHEIEPPRARGLEGEWRLALDPPVPAEIRLLVSRDGRLTLRKGEAKVDAKQARVSGARLQFTFDHAPFGDPGHFTLSGLLEGETLRGEGTRASGERFLWSAGRIGEAPPPEEKGETPAETPDLPGLPFGPYALAAPPEQPEAVIVRNATIWTCGPAGILEGATLVVRRGKVESVGGVAPEIPGAVVIDASGKHVTPGIIDCHSHTGISKGVNEAGQAVTAEVRIADVTNPDAIGWYRELAGGVTTVNSLHGSANVIGGQNCVNKIRWGCVRPDEMHFEGAPPGIKFALGENPKQSNWGDRHTTRYPQTRMGVETLLRDRLLAAREYATKRPGRRDLELEALAEVLSGSRLVHCHSYRQDEILMLCRVSEEFGFRIGTFQHVLEGYKVADAIRARALGGSSFTDWWAYKVEVQDAIPENGAILHEAGVCVSFNSDSDELARRMNVEAAKAVKYGAVARVEALKFVTLNPAIQLGIADQVGSLEPGKDADFAIWSGDPLSTLTRCESTWIDGREFFSLAQDRRHRERIASERRRLVEKILASPDEEEEKAAGKGSPAFSPGEALARAVRRERFLDLLRRGQDPAAARCGVCGCEEVR